MTTRAEYLIEIENLIRDKYRCHATWRQAVFVHEKTANSATVWFGNVEVFALDGCGESNTCYAWQCAECGLRTVTVLHSNLVDSPHRAVQAAVFTGIQPPLADPADDPTILRQRIERAKKALHEVALKAEDLEAIMQATRQTSQSISQKRQ